MLVEHGALVDQVTMRKFDVFQLYFSLELFFLVLDRNVTFIGGNETRICLFVKWICKPSNKKKALQYLIEHLNGHIKFDCNQNKSEKNLRQRWFLQ